MRVSIICLLLTVIAGCSASIEQETAIMLVPQRQVVVHNNENIVADAIAQLADELFDRRGLIVPEATVAVGTFADVRSLELNDDDSSGMKHLARQFQEGLKTALSRKGIRVIEFRLRHTIALKEDQDVMLSRQLSDIQTNHEIDYFLTGTLAEQPMGVIVNAQLVNVQSKVIITAASKTLPQRYWSGQANSTMSNKMIYRGSH